MLDLSALPAILSNQGNTSLLSVTSGGTVLAPKLTTFTDTDLTIDGTATVPTKQITSYTGGTITVNSGTPDFSGLTSIAGDAVYANGGAVVAFPTATALSTPASYNTTIQASGTSGSNGTGTPSEVDLSHVTSLTGTSDNVIFFNAYSGGEVNLSHLASNPSGRNFFQVSGSGSVLDLSSLPSAISDQDNNSEINVSTGGTLLDPLLTALDRTDLSVNGSATVATAQITSITGSQVFASDGAVIAFPGLTALSTYSGANLSIQASGTSGTGTPSEVDLSHVTSLTGTSDNVYFFNAYSGGELDLSHLASNPSGRNFFQVSGSGSVLDLSSLPSVVSDQDNNSEINVATGGTLLDPLLTALMRTDLSVDGPATVATAQITSITGSQVFASDGAVIAFPGLTALSTYSGLNLSIQASGTSGTNGTGTPSEVDLSHVTSLTGTSDNVYFFNAYSGGKVDLSHLASNPSGRNFFQVSGSGSVLDLSSLPSIVSDQDNNSLLSADSSGTILLDGGTVNLSRVDVTVTNGGTITAGTVQLLPGSSLSGDGTIAANVNSAVATSPGNGNTGILTIDGNFAQYGDGSLDIQIGGTDGRHPVRSARRHGRRHAGRHARRQPDQRLHAAEGQPVPDHHLRLAIGPVQRIQRPDLRQWGRFQTVYAASELSLVGALAAIRVSPATGLVTSKAGDPTEFTVVLATKPSANVTLNLSSSNTSEGTVSPASLTFTTVRLERAPDGRRHGRQRQPVGQRPLPGRLRAGGEHRRQLRRSDGRPGLAHQPAQRGGDPPGRQPRRLPLHRAEPGVEPDDHLGRHQRRQHPGHGGLGRPGGHQEHDDRRYAGDRRRPHGPERGRPARPGGVDRPAVRLHPADRGRRHGQHPGHRHRQRQPQRLRDGDQARSMRTSGPIPTAAITRSHRPRSPWAGSTSPWCRTGRRRAAWASSRPPAAGPRSTSRSTSPARPRSTR